MQQLCRLQYDAPGAMPAVLIRMRGNVTEANNVTYTSRSNDY